MLATWELVDTVHKVYKLYTKFTSCTQSIQAVHKVYKLYTKLSCKFLVNNWLHCTQRSEVGILIYYTHCISSIKPNTLFLCFLHCNYNDLNANEQWLQTFQHVHKHATQVCRVPESSLTVCEGRLRTHPVQWGHYRVYTTRTTLQNSVNSTSA